MGCLDKIIGLSRKDCDCYTDDRPGDWNESLSGIYLDELTGLSQSAIETSTDCGEGSVWDIMSRALVNGERRFRTDLLSALNNKYKQKFPPFEGVIGEKKFNGFVPYTEPLCGVRIESNCIKGSCFILKGIDAFFDTTLPALTVTIYRSDSDTPFVPAFDIQTEAFKKKANPLSTPIELPLYVDGLDEFNYHIVYDLPVNVKPCNTKIQCKCNNNKKRPWALWVDVEGITGPLFTTSASLDDLSGKSFTYGLNLNAQIECKKGNIICQEGQVWDFENDDIALQIAYAIQEISGVMLINEILIRPDSAYFALNEEQLGQLGAQHAASYQNRIDYLSLNMIPTSDCFICGNQMKGVAILS